jgi:hypothetical protein
MVHQTGLYQAYSVSLPKQSGGSVRRVGDTDTLMQSTCVVVGGGTYVVVLRSHSPALSPKTDQLFPATQIHEHWLATVSASPGNSVSK